MVSHFLNGTLYVILALSLLFYDIFPLYVPVVELILFLFGRFDLILTLKVVWNTVTVRWIKRFLCFILLFLQKCVHSLLVKLLHIYFGRWVEGLDVSFLVVGPTSLMLTKFNQLFLVVKRSVTKQILWLVVILAEKIWYARSWARNRWIVANEILIWNKKLVLASKGWLMQLARRWLECVKLAPWVCFFQMGVIVYYGRQHDLFVRKFLNLSLRLSHMLLNWAPFTI